MHTYLALAGLLWIAASSLPADEVTTIEITDNAFVKDTIRLGINAPCPEWTRLEPLQAQDWCVDLGTYRPSCHAILAAVRDSRGAVSAAMTIIGFPQDLPPHEIARAAKLLLDAAQQAERRWRKAGP